MASLDKYEPEWVDNEAASPLGPMAHNL
jgi:hypothetical protein